MAVAMLPMAEEVRVPRSGWRGASAGEAEVHARVGSDGVGSDDAVDADQGCWQRMEPYPAQTPQGRRWAGSRWIA